MMLIYQTRVGLDANDTRSHVPQLMNLAASNLFLTEEAARADLEEAAFRWWEATIWRGHGHPDYHITWTSISDDPNDAYVTPLLVLTINGVPKERFTATIYRCLPLDQTTNEEKIEAAR